MGEVGVAAGSWATAPDHAVPNANNAVHAGINNLCQSRIRLQPIMGLLLGCCAALVDGGPPTHGSATNPNAVALLPVYREFPRSGVTAL
jgi:hypothetical protein